MQYVYLLYSPLKDSFYIGCTERVDARLQAHNAKLNASTRHGAPWRLIYYEAYECRSDAFTRERKLKHHARGLIELKKRVTVKERNGEGGVPR